jgi:hypothetical protein
MLQDLLLGECESHVMHVGCYRTGYTVGLWSEAERVIISPC